VRERPAISYRSSFAGIIRRVSRASSSGTTRTPRPGSDAALMTEAMTELPRGLSTKEAALHVAMWLSRQPSRRLHHMRVLCELAELPPCLRMILLKPGGAAPPGD
jgi:hypothetical protein